MKHLTLLFEAVKPNFPCMHRKTNRVRCNPKNIHKQSKFKELNLKGDTFCSFNLFWFADKFPPHEAYFFNIILCFIHYLYSLDYTYLISKRNTNWII